MKLIDVGRSDLARVRRLINVANRESLAAFAGLQRREHGADIVFAAARARLAIEAAECLLATCKDGEPERARLAELLRITRTWAQGGLPETMTMRTWCEVFLLLARVGGESPATIDMSDIALAELEIEGLDLNGAIVRRSRLRNCRLEACAFANARFDDCIIESCNFARSNLAGATLVRASVTRSRFDGAMMSDTSFDHAVFIECDLRGADLCARKRGDLASSMSAEFVRCDLRETNWEGRMLSGVRMVDCKVYGIHGGPLLDGAEIHGPDLSIGGDGSRIGSASDVLGAWGC